VSVQIWIAVTGAGIGVLYGLFGVGSAFATPVLALLGVSPMAAVVGPLPGLLPGSAAGAWNYARTDKIDWWVARRTLAGALPAAVFGAIASQFVGGPVLLAMSGVVLLVLGVRVLRPSRSITIRHLATVHAHPHRLVGLAAAVGFAAGLLANGGGFLLVPLFLLYLGLDMNRATGTSLIVAAALAVPTLVTHAVIGDINWAVSGLFALGLVPGARLGAAIAERVPTQRLQLGFGALLVGFALWFLLRLALAG